MYTDETNLSRERGTVTEKCDCEGLVIAVGEPAICQKCKRPLTERASTTSTLREKGTDV